MAEELEFFKALEAVLYPLTTASSLLRVVDRADREGVLRQLRDGADVADLANVTGRSNESARALCAALVANGIAEAYASGFRLTPPWRAVTAEGTFIRLRDVLAQSRVIDALMSGGQTTYSTLSPADRSAFAHAVSPNPYAPELVDRIRKEIAEDPWWAPMATGGRYLELGCGIAGRMLTMLQAMPLLRAVGVELDPDLAEEARQRAADLNLQDRVEIIAADATTYRSEDAFDFGWWSQWFFPSSTREAALASMLANLRAGGVVRAPSSATTTASPRSRSARRLVSTRWTASCSILGGAGAHSRSVAAEFEEAGFTDVTIAPGDIATAVYARAP